MKYVDFIIYKNRTCQFFSTAVQGYKKLSIRARQIRLNWHNYRSHLPPFIHWFEKVLPTALLYPCEVNVHKLSVTCSQTAIPVAAMMIAPCHRSDLTGY